MNLTLIIQSQAYTQAEPYQSQLFPAVLATHSCRVLEHADIVSGRVKLLDGADKVVCMLPVRNILRNTSLYARFCGDTPTAIFDYDPWCFFDDDSPLKGGYQAISSELNCEFLVSNKHWADFARSKGVRTQAVRLGTTPSLCSAGRPFSARSIPLAFRGSAYPQRTTQFEKLVTQGLEFRWFIDKLPFTSFLNWCAADVQCWVQNEDSTVFVDGIKFERKWLTSKALETASQGCFILRNNSSECQFYELDKLPTALLWEDISQATALYEKFKSMSDQEKNERSNEAVRMIAARDSFRVIAANL